MNFDNQTNSRNQTVSLHVSMSHAGGHQKNSSSNNVHLIHSWYLSTVSRCQNKGFVYRIWKQITQCLIRLKQIGFQNSST